MSDSSQDASGGDGAPAVDAAPDACVPKVRIAVQFTATNIYGSGSSSLDVMLNHPNGFVLTVPMWTEERGIDSIGPMTSFKTAIKGTYAMDYTGQDEALLDSQVGAFLTVGGAFRQSVIDLSDNKSIFLYALPAQTTMHPYMDTRCNNAPFTTDAQSNFPVPKSFTATGCSVTFFDFRAPTQRNVVAQANSTLELTYQSCQ
ncbi:MAG TPA: hypothetical protein VN253_06725 [Kofleriaceae bacterium]|nr:hypothetical protein [Kofleriaceae bacterium]